jgi:hypothetical protein
MGDVKGSPHMRKVSLTTRRSFFLSFYWPVRRVNSDEGVCQLMARALAVESVPDWDDEILSWIRFHRYLCEWAHQDGGA